MAKDKNIVIFFIQLNLPVSPRSGSGRPPAMSDLNTKFRALLSSFFFSFYTKSFILRFGEPKNRIPI